MSASEVIEMIKKLPPNDRREVVEFLVESQKSDEGERQVRTASSEAFESAVGEVFNKYDNLLRKLAQ